MHTCAGASVSAASAPSFVEEGSALGTLSGSSTRVPSIAVATHAAMLAPSASLNELFVARSCTDPSGSSTRSVPALLQVTTNESGSTARQASCRS